MSKIVALVEGPGDIEAVPELLRRVLYKKQQWTWQVARPKRVGGLGALKKRLDDGCPETEAINLAQQIRSLNLSCPVAIVFAHREYEAWFLASLDSIARQFHLLPADLTYGGDVEGIRDVKGWFTRQMPPGRAYKETIHQTSLTTWMDLDVACQNSRSFRRLCDAVEELLTMSANNQRGQVTPSSN
jgi:hypothetical protein